MNIFQDKKNIHINLDKDVHAALRTKLFPHGLSMQEIIEEFVRCLVNDTQATDKIINNYLSRRLRDAIEREAQRKQIRVNKKSLTELDHEALYNLIDEDRNKNAPVRSETNNKDH
jgi:hypothetical protein